MTAEQLTYLVFGCLLVLALVFDLGLLSKKSSHITVKKALWQTIFWVSLAMCFFVFVWFEDGRVVALEYLSAYLTEWSLSIDNIFCIHTHLFFFWNKRGLLCPRTVAGYFNGHHIPYYFYCSRH